MDAGKRSDVVNHTDHLSGTEWYKSLAFLVFETISVLLGQADEHSAGVFNGSRHRVYYKHTIYKRNTNRQTWSTL